MSNILNFGKYKGQSIENVYVKDYGYARWLKNQEIIIGKFPDIKAFLEEKFKGTDNSFLLTWGKHRNQTINWIHENDPNYFQWLLKNDYVATKCPKLKSELEKLNK